MSEQAPKPAIAELNDQFRKTSAPLLTPGVMGFKDMFGLLMEVRHYDDFTADNDPYGEHDFGAVEWEGEHVFWKIDYYDETMQYLGDASDPDCNRVLTVMLAEEY